MTQKNISGLAALLVKNIRPGAVLYKHCDFTTPPKSKFMVVASTSPRLLVLLINSAINKFYYDRKLDSYHVLIPYADHSFLDHDSYANCIESHTAFDLSEIQSDVVDNYNATFKGFLTDNCLAKVYAAVKENKILERSYKREITASIEAQLPYLNPPIPAAPALPQDEGESAAS